MLELVYPLTRAPFVPAGRSFGDDSAKLSVQEILPVIEESGLVVARAAREDCHSAARYLHPVIHLHIINRSAEIYLQKRSARKILLPGVWDTAVGGHVSYGERVEETLFREASEEIGLQDFNPIFLDSYVWETEVEREMVSVFAAVGNFDLHPDNLEVEEGRFWSASEIEANLGKGVFTPNFESEFRRFYPRLEALL